MASRVPVAIRHQEVPKDLVCPICFELPLDPYIVQSCSHVFCKDCFQHSIIRDSKCPMCRCDSTLENLVPLKTENPLSYRIWANIAVKCDRHSEGCGWVGSISTYESHKEHCVGEKKIESNRSLEEEISDLKDRDDELRWVNKRLLKKIKKLEGTVREFEGTICFLEEKISYYKAFTKLLLRVNNDLLKKNIKLKKPEDLTVVHFEISDLKARNKPSKGQQRQFEKN